MSLAYTNLLGTAMRDADQYCERHIEYEEFLSAKSVMFQPCGFEPGRLNPNLFPFQADIVRWACRRGRAALFEDCGLGKTIQQLEWARLVSAHTEKPVLIFAPLAVSTQTRNEGSKFGIDVSVVHSDSDAEVIRVTNYEKLHHFTPDGLGGLVLDESSILKGFDGKTRKALTEFASNIPYRLACTATPAPNDYMELGNHAEFLGVMKLQEMLATFFVHDGGDTSKWRLKGHAETLFWKWVCSWAVAIRKPSDLGYSNDGFDLPPLRLHEVTVDATDVPAGYLFPVEAASLSERIGARRDSVAERARACAEIVNGKPGYWVIWCNLNAEADALLSLIPDAIEVRGSDKDSEKERKLNAFSRGEIRVLITKSSIAGFGMNWQHCCQMATFLTDSFEQFYQAVRRCWRFGQQNPVDCHVIAASTEGAVVRNIERKEKQAQEMIDGMVKHMTEEMQREVRTAEVNESDYVRRDESGAAWRMILGDCVEEISVIPSDSIHFSVFSPPFASLYTYTNSDRDMGNCRSHAEFYEHFKFLVPQLYRVLKPGRLVSFHCMNLPLSKERDGIIGIRDFRGELIRMFNEAGFVFHSEVCIWKDPVTAMQRTKALGLLYKQLRKDSAMSRQGIPDYLVTMRKPGENTEPVTKTHSSFPVSLWQRYASPVWMDINPSDTLQKESAREEEDERHICPLQLQVIERAIELWTNPGDFVLSPFAGIGSEGYVALQRGRRFLGLELKESYWKQAVANLKAAELRQDGLFTEAAEQHIEEMEGL